MKELDGNGGGIRVRIEAANGLQFNHFHMQAGSNSHLQKEQQVRQGQIIGNLGGLGLFDLNNFAPHLHYEIWDANGTRLNPYAIHPELLPLHRRK